MHEEDDDEGDDEEDDEEDDDDGDDEEDNDVVEDSDKGEAEVLPALFLGFPRALGFFPGLPPPAKLPRR